MWLTRPSAFNFPGLKCWSCFLYWSADLWWSTAVNVKRYLLLEDTGQHSWAEDNKKQEQCVMRSLLIIAGMTHLPGGPRDPADPCIDEFFSGKWGWGKKGMRPFFHIYWPASDKTPVHWFPYCSPRSQCGNWWEDENRGKSSKEELKSWSNSLAERREISGELRPQRTNISTSFFPLSQNQTPKRFRELRHISRTD